MATYFVGSASAGDNDGSSWTNRYGLLNDAEDTPLIAGDKVIVGPGTFRERLQCDVSGGSGYSTGTVDVTYDSASIAGTGTSFVGGSVAANDYLHIRYYDQGTDGVTDGASNFTSATGNFQSNMVGLPIQINNHGAYTIDSIVDATSSITLADPNSLGWPSASTALTYSVMSGEGHHEIDSVDSDTGLTLKQPWQGKTVTGLSYLTFTPIIYIADVTGVNTNGVGGVVRITGSDNDQTATRAEAIDCNSQNYRVFRGFFVDTTTQQGIHVDSSDHIILEDISAFHCKGVRCENTAIAMTLRRFIGMGHGQSVIHFDDVTDDTGIVVENALVYGSGIYVIRLDDVGGTTFRNVTVLGGENAFRNLAAPTTGQCHYITNSIITGAETGLFALGSGQIIEDYNTLFQNDTARQNVGTGSNSVAYSPLLKPPILYAGDDELAGYKFPWSVAELSEWSQVTQITGVDERNTDLFGIQRPATASKNSWGAMQFNDASRETTEIRSGSVSIKLADAGHIQLWVPASPVSTEVSVHVMRASSYAGTAPQMVVNQPGQAASTLTDGGAASQWNVLNQTFTPASAPPYFTVDLVSNNTATCSGFEVYFDDFNAS